MLYRFYQLPPARLEAALPIRLSLGLLAVLPMAALLPLVGRARRAWLVHLRELVMQMMQGLFARRVFGSVLLVSLLAGTGEELLFRAVLQAWLGEHLGIMTGLILASVVFGLAHAVSRSYLLVATAIGLYLGLLFLWLGLLPAMLTHAVYDWLAIHYYLRLNKNQGEPPDYHPAQT